jgi:hypothetical protein
MLIHDLTNLTEEELTKQFSKDYFFDCDDVGVYYILLRNLLNTRSEQILKNGKGIK